MIVFPVIVFLMAGLLTVSLILIICAGEGSIQLPIGRGTKNPWDENEIVYSNGSVKLPTNTTKNTMIDRYKHD